MTDQRSPALQLTGYFPGVLGKITDLHATYYYKNWGLDVTFETQVGRELSEFIQDFDEDRDGLWVAQCNRRFAGSVAIDGRTAKEEGARLRWLIVDPVFEGQGFGRALLSRAIRFLREKHYKKAFLWTFEGLEAARHLYESEGFILSDERDVHQWGKKIREQRFELDLWNSGS